MWVHGLNWIVWYHQFSNSPIEPKLNCLVSPIHQFTNLPIEPKLNCFVSPIQLMGGIYYWRLRIEINEISDVADLSWEKRSYILIDLKFKHAHSGAQNVQLAADIFRFSPIIHLTPVVVIESHQKKVLNPDFP